MKYEIYTREETSGNWAWAVRGDMNTLIGWSPSSQRFTREGAQADAEEWVDEHARKMASIESYEYTPNVEGRA